MKQMNPGASLDSPANNTGIHNTKEHKGTKTFALLYYGDSEMVSLLSLIKHHYACFSFSLNKTVKSTSTTRA